MSTELTILLWILGLIVLTRYLKWRLDSPPRGRWFYFLMNGEPRRVASWLHVDVPRMTRKELLDSGLRAMTWGLAMAALWIVNVMVATALYKRNETPAFFWVTSLVFAFFCLMGVMAALYLLVRGVFRRAGYLPPHQRNR